jgi:hypothetical protein
MTQSLLDLARKQLTVMAEVTLQRVTVDDDPVLVTFAHDTVSEVLAICMHLVSKIGYHDRDLRQYILEFSRQSIDCVDDQQLELVELRSFRHTSNDREPSAPSSSLLIAAVLGAPAERGSARLDLYEFVLDIPWRDDDQATQGL